MAALTAEVESALVERALDVQAALAEDAPVDTGFLRDNFQLSVGVPAEGTVPVGTPLNVAAVAAYKLGDGSIFIANNVEYIVAVNARGKHAGFADAAIDRGVNKP